MGIIQAVTHLISPRVCQVCGCSLNSDEQLMCLNCRIGIPRFQNNAKLSELQARIGVGVNVEHVTAWMQYIPQAPYSRLITEAKYQYRPRQAQALGRICADELAPTGIFADIDALVPSPIYWRKRMKRGYNQTEEICRGISAVTGLPIINAIRAISGHGVQARHTLTERMAAIKDTFAPAAGIDLAGKRVMLVDDIITSGATIAEGVRALALTQPSAISVLAIAATTQQ